MPYTASARAWLAQLLAERFGHNFNIEQLDQHTLLLQHPSSPQQLTIESDSSSFTRNDSQLPCAHWDATSEGWESALSMPLPAPGVAQLTAPLITTAPSGWHIHYDILGLTYWMLTRSEELERSDLDEHGRFPAPSSHAYHHQYLERPLVDEWLHILRQVLQRTWPHLPLTQPRFTMRVSHDVDAPSLYAFQSWYMIARMMGGHLLKRRDLKAFISAPYLKATARRRINPHDPFNSFDWLMDLSERHNLRSAFYFLSGGDHAADADYRLEQAPLRHLLRHIHQRGHEIGLHPSYATYQQPSLIRQQADTLRRICAAEGIEQPQWGGRMHYLRWEQPTTMQAWEAAAMDYDSTLSYADHAGFRCGTCFEYPAFNPSTQQMLKLRIRPLIAMECSVIADRYMNLGLGAAALDKFIQLKQACRAVNGCFTLLWHNSQLTSAAERELYAAVLG